MFFGFYSLVVMGDYVVGFLYVLLISGMVRWVNGLCVNDFFCSLSVIEYNESGLVVDVFYVCFLV